jgi:hypothetical protein
MNVTTTVGTPRGAYPLTIWATSGAQTRPVNVTLVLNGDFAILATPVSQTITPGGIATYMVTIAAGPAFTGIVNLAVIGAPLSSTRVFDPPSIANAGSSVLTVDTFANVLRQTRTLTLIASGGGRVRSANVVLTIAAPQTAGLLAPRLLPGGLSLAAAEAAAAALDDQADVRASLIRNADHKQEFLNQALSRMIRPMDPVTDFVMFNTRRPLVDVIEHFRRHGVLDPISAFDTAIRVSLGTPAEMREFWRVWDLMAGHAMIH